MARIWWGVLCCLLMSCMVTLDTGDAYVTCKKESDCPSGMTCRDSIERCVPSDLTDEEPPELVDVEVEPTRLLYRGSSISIVFSVKEELNDNPLVTLRVAGEIHSAVFAETTLIDEEEEISSYRYTYAVTGDEQQGDGTLVAAVADIYGNAAELDLGPIRFDFEPPFLDVITVQVPGGKPAVNGSETLAFSSATETDASIVSVLLKA